MEKKATKKDSNWIYEYDNRYPCKYEITNVRYVLGEVYNPLINKSLICIGINPSTAIPEGLDDTLNRVANYAKKHKDYGAWYMINIYPQRATDPDDLDMEPNAEIWAENLRHIEELIKTVGNADIWCAWGQLVAKRDYLKSSLKEILVLIEKHKKIAYNTTVKGYPRHPLTMPKEPIFKEVVEANPNGTIKLKE